ncbi:PREDICTED: bombyxin A-3 homolog [Papilio polytes]|uniref:bombyxin A-3 homolog n=1 Tax=Papilio polytes TaxID=76194 RepID=UPI0006768C9D|nr:PREDICTED: bombyxin A-3 homolog [Papilio polytes]
MASVDASRLPHQDDFGQMYCGRRLASALALLCEGVPQTMLVKRSGEFSQQGTWPWPWLSAQRARSLHRNKRQTVVAECCDKPCTIDELTNYC